MVVTHDEQTFAGPRIDQAYTPHHMMGTFYEWSVFGSVSQLIIAIKSTNQFHRLAKFPAPKNQKQLQFINDCILLVGTQLFTAK